MNRCIVAAAEIRYAAVHRMLSSIGCHPRGSTFRLEAAKCRIGFSCPACKQDFKHSQVSADSSLISDPFGWLEAKPALPEGGQLECRRPTPEQYDPVGLERDRHELKNERANQGLQLGG